MDSETKEENQDNFLTQLNTLNKIITSFKETCKISSYCFDKCVSYPEKSLSNTNKKCIWNCTQRYLECDYFIKNRSKDSGKLDSLNFLDEVNMNASRFNKSSGSSEYILKD
ncbi:mitochondrial import inner membrane translocase subunit TIM8, putative [Plasmodium ovale]|uniref:Mitochondrial import inner membrane translocase subunit n=1 Tax=Plasmodium ovale TaxID=36330 RepID=A0A1C3KXD9_PLAOA|nr:mitochondrial import inner membrane translocase subunit TIM8, putative [Plasmodium ovale]